MGKVLLDAGDPAVALAPGVAASPTVLYVDLDGTLISGDVTLESFIRYMRRGVREFFQLLLWLLKGRAATKTLVARRTPLDPTNLPYRTEVINFIADARGRGQRVVLASGSHHSYVRKVANHLGIFDDAIGSSRRVNLKGRLKLAWIRKQSPIAFDYIGDSRVDTQVWLHADTATSVRYVPSVGSVNRLHCSAPSALSAAIKALRPHQWAKNILVFVPLVASGLWDSELAAFRTLLAAILFCATASGAYVLNDLIDIDADRAHKEKKRRPLASGIINIPLAAMLIITLLFLPIIIAPLILGSKFAIVLSGYLFLTTAYSLRLKSVMALDALVLASLYAMRIIAGAVAIAVVVSSWLLIFAIFIFLSLAYLKRYTELSAKQLARIKILGRGYYSDDCEIVMMTGIASGMVSVLVLALFIGESAASQQYQSPNLLWGLCLILIYWLNRIWMMARRGEVHGDPIAFAMTDRRSVYLGAIAVSLVFIAQRIALGI